MARSARCARGRSRFGSVSSTFAILRHQSRCGVVPAPSALRWQSCITPLGLEVQRQITMRWDGSPAAAARRLIMTSTTHRVKDRPVSRRAAGSTPWKSAVFGSSSPAAATYSSRDRSCPVVGRDVVPLPALLVEPQPASAPLPEVVLPPHPQDRAHPREVAGPLRVRMLDTHAVARSLHRRPEFHAGEPSPAGERNPPAALARRPEPPPRLTAPASGPVTADTPLSAMPRWTVRLAARRARHAVRPKASACRSSRLARGRSTVENAVGRAAAGLAVGQR